MERYKRWTVIAYGVLTLLCGIAAFVFASVSGYDDMVSVILIVPSFIILGMLIKYGDQSYDSDCFSKKLSNILSVPCGVWMGAMILLDQNVATIFTGMLIALLIASKYDNLAFRLGFAVAFIAAVINVLLDPGDVNYIGIIIILVTAFIDEMVSDLADIKNGKSIVWTVFKERPVMKIAVLALCITSVLSSYYYFFAFLGFDLGYSFIARLADSRGCEPAAA